MRLATDDMIDEDALDVPVVDVNAVERKNILTALEGMASLCDAYLSPRCR